VGTPEEVYYQPRTLFVAQFLGRTNLLFSQAAGNTAKTPLGPIGLNRPAAGDVLLAVRPEHLTLGDPETGGGQRGRVVGREFKGHDITFRVEMNGAEYLVHTDNLVPYQTGDIVSVRPLAPAIVLENRTSEFATSSGATRPLPAQRVERSC
jgi:iron(III) transport system ATP-binding protein